MGESAFERGRGSEALQHAIRVRCDQPTEGRNETRTRRLDGVAVCLRNLKPREVVVDAQFRAEPWREHTADARADAPSRRGPLRDLPSTGSSVAIRPGNGAVIPTWLVSSAVAA